MKIMTGASVKGLKKGSDNVTASVAAGSEITEITVDRVILAIGIVGNVENLGLEGSKVKVEKTHVVIDQRCATGEPGVYAIGDLVGPPWLAHKAMDEGVICVEGIAGLKGVHPLDVSKIPDPLAPENLMKTSGRGIFLIRSFMDEVQINPSQTGTEVKLIKHVHGPAADGKEASL